MMKTILWMVLFAVFAFVLSSWADQVVLQNGDTLNGTVLSLSNDVVVLKDENLGEVLLPRAKVTGISFGAVTTKPAAALGSLPVLGATASETNSATDLTSGLRGIRDQTNLIQQVQSQILGTAGPDATGKFNELLDGLSTGKVDINDLRAQAQSAADQLRSLKGQLGPEDSGEVDSYLSELDNFLKETAPPTVTTNAAHTEMNTSVGP